MPNYQLVATSMFEPYSYERYLEPLATYSGAYKELEDALADLQTKASVWEGMANELTDPNTYKKYKTYADDLRAQVDALASQGLTPTSRRDMLNLKSRYSAEITPIEQAYTQRAELLKAQREALLKDPSLIFERDLSDPTIASLDNFVGNSGYGYGNVYSGNKLREDVSKAAKNLSSTLRSKNESGAELRKKLQMVLPYLYRLLELRGFDSDEVLAAIANDENASGILRDLVEGTVDASGIKNWGSEESVDRARAYAALGLWDAIGTPTEKWLTDTYSMLNAKSGDKTGENNIQDLSLPLAGYGTIIQDDVKRKASPGIKSLYTGINNEGKEIFDSKYLGADGNTNPMRLYELWDNYKKENINRWAYYNSDPRTLERETARVKEEFKKEYDVNPDDIINKDQYKALESLGFTADDDVSTFTDTNSAALLEGAAVVYRPTLINLSRYDTPVMERALSALNLEDFKNDEDLVIDYNTGKSVKPKKLNLGDSNTKVSNVQYDIRYPDRIILLIGLNRYAVDSSMFDDDIRNLLYQVNLIIKSGISRAESSQLQDEAAKLIQSKLQSFDPIKSETSSKAE